MTVNLDSVPWTAGLVTRLLIHKGIIVPPSTAHLEISDQGPPVGVNPNATTPHRPFHAPERYKSNRHQTPPLWAALRH
jgi:hypothetical protein